MYARNRGPGDGIRSGSIGLGGRISPDGSIREHGMHRNFNNWGLNRGHHPKPYLPPPPTRKADIFMQAGRLAAEYLVSKGLLPPSSLPVNWSNGNSQEFKVQDRENPTPPRTSALSRLGNTVPYSGHERRRSNEEFNHMGSRSHSRGRRRMGPYSRGYGPDWGRENGRNGPWMERARVPPDTMEGEDDFAPGYRRDWRGEIDEVRSSVSRIAADELLSKSETTGESETELENYEIADDTGSKASSSSTRKDPPPEADMNSNKGQDDAKVLNSETGEEVKSGGNDDLENKIPPEEDLAMQPCAVGADPVSNHGNDLLKLCGFARVPTKPRSSLPHRSLKVDHDPVTEASNTYEVTLEGASKAIAEEDLIKGSSDDYCKNQIDSLKCQAPDFSDVLLVQSIDESVDPQSEPSQHPPGFGISRTAVDMEEDDSSEQCADKMEGDKIQRESSPSEYSCLSNLRAKQSTPDVEILSPDEEMIEAVDQEKLMGAPSFPNVDDESIVKLEEEKQLLPTSFKICDLNLMETPEITEIPDDPALGHIRTTSSTPKPEKVDFGLSIGNNNSSTDDYSRLSGEDKVVPVIDLEDDCPVEDSAFDSSKSKSEPVYPSLDNFLDQGEHADDLPGIQDGYGLAISEFLGSGISGCPSVPADLDNLHGAMSLHGAEVVPCDDDSIYVSLGEMGFLGVWDQPTQEYGKFF